MKIKVCGLTDPANIAEVAQLGVDYLGFIFYSKSKRYCTLHKEIIPSTLSKRVGVFVNASLDEVQSDIQRCQLDAIQLHGEESQSYIFSLREQNKEVEIIKAISVSDESSIRQAHQYTTCADYLLFDTASHLRGGSGKKFDWTLLDKYQGDLPFFISGGIDVEDAPVLQSWNHPLLYGIDLNSRFETRPGIKDINLLNTFIKTLYHE